MVGSIVTVAIRKASYSLCAVLLLFCLHSPDDAQVDVKLPEMTGQAGTEVRIPLTIGDLGKSKVTAFEFVVSCDTSVLRFSGVEQTGTLSEGLAMFANNRVAPFNPGRMKVVCASATPISGKGVLVKIIGTLGKQGGTSPVSLSHVVLNAGVPEARLVHGVIRSRDAAGAKRKR